MFKIEEGKLLGMLYILRKSFCHLYNGDFRSLYTVRTFQVEMVGGVVMA